MSTITTIIALQAATHQIRQTQVMHRLQLLEFEARLAEYEITHLANSPESPAARVDSITSAQVGQMIAVAITEFQTKYTKCHELAIQARLSQLTNSLECMMNRRIIPKSAYNREKQDVLGSPIQHVGAESDTTDGESEQSDDA